MLGDVKILFQKYIVIEKFYGANPLSFWIYFILIVKFSKGFV